MNCPIHASEPITGTCERCGNFVCALDARVVDAKTFCVECAQHPEIDYVEAYRRELWGKRDGYAWLAGLGAVVNGLIALYFLVASTWAFFVVAMPGRGFYATMGVAGGYALLLALVDAAYFFRRRWARVAFGLPMFASVFTVIAWSVRPPVSDASILRFTLAIVSGVLAPLVFGIGAFVSTRNKLFFELDVPPEEVRKLWDKERNNSSARLGLIWSFSGFLFPGLSLMALGFSLHGLWCVDPAAKPPIGRRGQATLGVLLSLVGLAFWTVVGLSAR